jgi:hypothetical protein
MSKPTNFSIPESLEVIWEVIHEWKEDLQNHEKEEREEDVDNVHTAMWWIMEELGYDIDRDGEITLAKVKGETA